jgi:hypothetical protein
MYKKCLLFVVYMKGLPEYAWNVNRPSDKQQLYNTVVM